MRICARGERDGKIWVDAQEDEAVLRAAGQLRDDLAAVCGAEMTVTHEWTDDVRIAVGTFGVSAKMSEMPPEELLDENGEARPEGLMQCVKDGKLWLCGTERRGTIYAIYRFSEMIGQSPWHRMADVPAKEKDEIELPDDYELIDWPEVRWRGIFLNDEEELEKWAIEHTHDGTIGPETYEKVYELILRLGGNLIWPAMHVNAFNMNPENGILAQKMGVVTGTSHCDMLHRSNQNEWEPWKKAKGYPDEQYDYSIPGENRERLIEYWRGSLEQNKDFDAIYTIGMRGIHDSGMVAEGMESTLENQRALMEEIFRVQRELIRENVGENVPQIFIPYKEVLPIYDSGLRVPEDVTLVWTDDNHGYVRRYPGEQEKKREGGNGLYYHSSYWSPPGLSWLFVCSVPIAHMGNELKKCWEQGIRRMWVDNVGALKAIEQDTEYFLRCAWYAGRENSPVSDPKRWTAEWINRNFSGNHGDEVAEIYTEFAQMSNVCKPEHMRSHTFSQNAYGDEAAARVEKLKEYSRRIDAVWQALPEDERDAFFQLMGMKIKATYYVAASYYFADRSLDAYSAGAMRSAEENMQKSREADGLKQRLIRWYNCEMSGGKWHGVLTPELFPPPPMETYPACAPALKTERGELVLRLLAGGMRFVSGERKWLDLMNSGSGDIEYTIAADEGIHLSREQGRFRNEERVFVWTDEDFREGEIRVNGKRIPVSRAAQESYIHLTEPVRAEGFRVIPYMGRGTGDAWEAGPETCPEKPARMEFVFGVKEKCAPEAEIIRFLTLNSVGRIRGRVILDGDRRQDWESEITDEWRGNWAEGVRLDGEKICLKLPEMDAGEHTLVIEVPDPYITVSCVNLYPEERRVCVLGPGILKEDAEIPDVDARYEAALFGSTPEEAPRGFVTYFTPEFWADECTYSRTEFEPRRPGEPVFAMDADGHKDVFALMDGGMPEEKDGSIRIDAMTALIGNENAGMSGNWRYRQSESYGGTGLAMTILLEEEAAPGSALRYRFRCDGGKYRVWILSKHDDGKGFRTRFLLDGRPVSEFAEVCHENFHRFRAAYVWAWMEAAELEMSAGEHEWVIEALDSGLAIDRIYITAGEEKPPCDNQWA